METQTERAARLLCWLDLDMNERQSVVGQR